jgi:hypothetical protein
MASPFATPPSNLPGTSSYIGAASSLPPPPSEHNTPKKISQVHRAFAQYYWPRHFEKATCDPASFIDRVLTDYTDHETDPVGDWINNISPIYKAYRACLKYGAENGTPVKAQEARKYQGVFSNLRFWSWIYNDANLGKDYNCKICGSSGGQKQA